MPTSSPDKDLLLAVANSDPSWPDADLFQDLAVTTLVFGSGRPEADAQLFSDALADLRTEATERDNEKFSALLSAPPSPKKSASHRR